MVIAEVRGQGEGSLERTMREKQWQGLRDRGIRGGIRRVLSGRGGALSPR